MYNELDLLEDKCFGNEECKAFDGSWEHQKAVDYDDTWSDTVRVFNLCRCNTWVATTCEPCGDGVPAPQGGAASSSLLLLGSWTRCLSCTIASSCRWIPLAAMSIYSSSDGPLARRSMDVRSFG